MAPYNAAFVSKGITIIRGTAFNVHLFVLDVLQTHMTAWVALMDICCKKPQILLAIIDVLKNKNQFAEFYSVIAVFLHTAHIVKYVYQTKSWKHFF